MILISTSGNDPSSDQVTRWLKYYKAAFTRLNDRILVEDIEYVNGKFMIHLTDKTVLDFSKIKAYWYRRGEFGLSYNTVASNVEAFDKEFNLYFYQEMKSLMEFFQNNLKKNVITIGNSLSCLRVNKNSILLLAAECGLNTPATLITGRRDTAIEFVKKYKQAITKPLFLPFMERIGDVLYPTYTEMVDEEHLSNAPSTFRTTLFQQYIEKKFELRVFYINGECYSMAIFSQNDPQTSVDFRHYNDDKPNRRVPFNLPKEMQGKINQLMNKLGYESGSIDLIYTHDKHYYFLEVNPVGQFGMVSFPCNYYLEKNIAQKLNTNALVA